MKTTTKLTVLLTGLVILTSCVSKKKFAAMQTSLLDEVHIAKKEVEKLGVENNACKAKLEFCEKTLSLRQEQVGDLKLQRDKQMTQVGDLTVLTKSANDNIKETLSQLEKKDKYIHLLYAAKNKADSMNLALAVNLKSELKDGIEDKDIEIKVDKTVVFVNLSDKMLYKTGSANLTPRAHEVLAKIAQILKNRTDLEVMVEGYTDNTPISTNCIDDNWDLSVKRATSVVRVLETKYGVDPNKLIAAGRGQYNTLASNDTAEGRSKNRRTRVIILPKLNQFYDLLNPNATK